MKACAITHRGGEDAAEREIKALIGKVAEKGETVLFFDASGEELVRLVYLAQSLRRVLILLERFSFSSDFFGKIPSLSLPFTPKTFRVRAKRVGEHPFTSEEVSGRVGEIILEGEPQLKVDLETPEMIVYAYVYQNTCTIGVDLCGGDLSKREYRLFTHPGTIKGTIAYALLALAGYRKEDALVDPFCRSGEVLIEAAHYANLRSVHFFHKEKFMFLKIPSFAGEKVMAAIDGEAGEDSLKVTGFDSLMAHIASAKKNAKVAGVQKMVSFSRVEVEWLDTKLKEGEVDIIVTHPPEVTKRVKAKDIGKLYRELFYQAKYVLNPKGRMVLLTKSRDVLMKFSGEFSLEKEQKIWQGKEEFSVLVFRKM